MSARVMHYHPKGTTGRGTICGRVLLGKAPNYTTHENEVTCARCIDKIHAKFFVTEPKKAKVAPVVDKKAVKIVEKSIKQVRKFIHHVHGGRDNIRVKHARGVLRELYDMLSDEKHGWVD